MQDSALNRAAVPLSQLKGHEWGHLMWGFFWRGLVYTLASAVTGGIVGGIAGAVLGFAMGSSGASLAQITSVARPVGFVLGLVVAVIGLRFYLGWILSARYGKLELAVLRPGQVSIPRAA